MFKTKNLFFLLVGLYGGLILLASIFMLPRPTSFLLQPLWATQNKNTLQLSSQETKALRREMVEMDLAVRNLSSVLAMGYRVTLRRNLQYLSKLQTLNNHKYQTAIKFAVKKMKAKNVYVHIESIQNEANALLQYLNKYQNSNRHWERVNTGYTRILNQCRACHEKTILE